MPFILASASRCKFFINVNSWVLLAVISVKISNNQFISFPFFSKLIILKWENKSSNELMTVIWYEWWQQRIIIGYCTYGVCLLYMASSLYTVLLSRVKFPCKIYIFYAVYVYKRLYYFFFFYLSNHFLFK